MSTETLLSDCTLGELQAENDRLNEVRASAKARQTLIASEIERRRALAAVRAMSPEQRRTLAEALEIRPESISSGETFGQIGG